MALASLGASSSAKDLRSFGFGRGASTNSQGFVAMSLSRLADSMSWLNTTCTLWTVEALISPESRRAA